MLFSLVLTGILIVACTFDLRTFRIPNAISLALIALFVIKVTAMAEIAIWTGHVLAATLIFSLTLAAFAFGIIGGGDAKFMTALALWFGMTALPIFLTVTAIGGGALALTLLAIRSLLDRDLLPVTSKVTSRRPRLLESDAPVPYALPIAFAALWLEWSSF